MKNNIEFDKAGFGVEGTHVAHHVLTCGLQHLVSDNNIAFWVQYVSIQDSLYNRRYTSFGEELIWMYWCNMCNTMFQHMQCNIWPCSIGHKLCCLVRFFLLILNQICCIFISNIWLICLSVVGDQIRIN